MKSPKRVLQELMPKIATEKLTESAIRSLLIQTWQDTYPAIQYFAPTQEVPKDSGSIDDLWGDDLGDVSHVLEKQSASSGGEYSLLSAHVAEEMLTVAQMKKMEFSGGGLILTFLKPQLDKSKVAVEKGGKVVYKGVKYNVLQIVEIVQWKAVGNLYLVANCGQ